MKTSTCKTCNQSIHQVKTSRGWRWAHPNGQTFCQAKAEQGGYNRPESVPDWKHYGAQCPSEFKHTAAYAAEVRHEQMPSENEDL